MTINITDKPEMNVVNIGDEITVDQLGAIQGNANNPSAANPFALKSDLVPSEAIIANEGEIVDGQTVISLPTSVTDHYANINLNTRNLGLTITITNTGDGIAFVSDTYGPPWAKFIDSTQTYATATSTLTIPAFSTRTISWRTTGNGASNWQGLMWFVS